MPPLIEHLVGRPPKTKMAINYARLCARYVLSCAMHGGGIMLLDFNDAAYRREDRQQLAQNTTLTVQDDGDPNALVPIGIEIALRDGRRLGCRVDDVYGAPENPMSRDAHLQKFRQNCRDGRDALPAERVETMIAMVDGLEDVESVESLVSVSSA